MAKSNFIVRGGLDMSDITKGLKQTQEQFAGFQKTLSGSLKLVKSAIGGLALGGLIKTSLEAASSLESAMVGLTSIVQGQGRDIGQAKSFINDYVKDGLIPLTDAVTAYKNLVARGYNDEQIKNTLLRLKDAAAFGRQSSYTLGEAVRSATEGLKNENSILVDNAGVTKNVSKMWEDYAKSIGKTANNLTTQEKIQAEVNGIMQETQWQVGDAAKYTDTYQGRLVALNKTLFDIKVNIGNAFMPIANVVLPILQSLGNKLTAITGAIAQFSQALFGTAMANATENTSTQTDAISDMGDAVEKAGKKAQKAGKQAQKATMSFDEINVLSSGSSSGSSSESSSGPMEGSSTTSTSSSSSTPEQTEGASKFADAAAKLKTILQPTVDALKNLWNAIVPFAQSIGKGFIDFVGSLKGYGEDALNGWIPGGINAIANGLNAIDPRVTESIGSGLGKIALAFGGFKIITGLADFFAGIGKGLVTLSGGMASIINLNPMAFIAMFYDEIDAIQNAIYDALPKWARDLYDGIWNAIITMIKSVFSLKATSDLANQVLGHFKTAFSGNNQSWLDIGKNVALGILKGLLLPFSLILEPINNFFKSLIKAFCDTFGINSPATTMIPYGQYVMLGFINGIKSGWTESLKTFTSWLSNIPKTIAASIGSMFNTGKSLMQTFVNGFKSMVLPKLKLDVSYTTDGLFGKIGKALGLPGFPKLDLKFYAQGGFPEDGLFMANHNELVGKFSNGKTAVANNEQITEGIKLAVIDGNSEQNALLRQQNSLLQAILAKTGISTKDIFSATKVEADNYFNVTGKPAFS